MAEIIDLERLQKVTTIGGFGNTVIAPSKTIRGTAERRSLDISSGPYEFPSWACRFLCIAAATVEPDPTRNLIRSCPCPDDTSQAIDDIFMNETKLPTLDDLHGAPARLLHPLTSVGVTASPSRVATRLGRKQQGSPRHRDGPGSTSTFTSLAGSRSSLHRSRFTTRAVWKQLLYVDSFSSAYGALESTVHRVCCLEITFDGWGGAKTSVRVFFKNTALEAFSMAGGRLLVISRYVARRYDDWGGAAATAQRHTVL